MGIQVPDPEPDPGPRSGKPAGSRTHIEPGELSLVLSRQRKFWVPQPDLSGSGMLTLIANLLPIYAGCPVRT